MKEVRLGNIDFCRAKLYIYILYCIVDLQVLSNFMNIYLSVLAYPIRLYSI